MKGDSATNVRSAFLKSFDSERVSWMQSSVVTQATELLLVEKMKDLWQSSLMFIGKYMMIV